MRDRRRERGVIAIAMTFALVISVVIAATMRMHKQRAPMPAMTLKRIQAANYAEAALYETFNRFRMNTDVYTQWNPNTWNDAVPVGRPTFTPDANGNVVVSGGNPIVRFKDPNTGATIVDVIIGCSTVAGQTTVTATVDYTTMRL